MIRDTSTAQVAHILIDCCDDNTLAALVDGLLCADAMGSLSDGDARIAERLFDKLTAAKPQLVEMAQNRTYINPNG